MKKLKVLLTSLLILIGSLTAFSQTTGISGLDREQKIQIASTLVEYPMVVRELEMTKDLLKISYLKNNELRGIVKNQVNQINMLTEKNNISERQVDISTQQVKAQTTSGKDKLAYGTGGIVVGVVLSLLISIF